jgi:heme oxygenase
MDSTNIPARDPLAELRHATALQHTVLDAGLPLAQAGATLQDYRGHLLMLRAWLQPIEGWLAGFDDGPQGPQAPPPVARSLAIDADLAVGEWAQGAVEADQTCPAWPAEASAAYRWGVCYVVEGSQLGGVVLYRRLAAQLAPHPLDYLKGSAEGPGPRWRAFSEALRTQVRGSEQIADACAGACEAFDRILALRTVYR